ncbi:hypothetical protein [Ahrensia sp. 13_GOM-1096m]|uniref:hypothetical protein n=1 Tax=Ahrensia sp. 13_GOM-1096m TaxID=1380380 RepID=UPI000478B404|nr:hypothetical protein [Ahrensia sp. 13_GOM-1096m]
MESNILATSLRLALSRYELCVGETLSPEPNIELLENEDFIAFAEPDGDGVRVHVSIGVVLSLTDLWQKAKAYSDSLPEEDQLNFEDVDQAIDASLQWLMLHELHHFEMGHFKLTGGRGIAETSQSKAFGLTQRSAQKPALLDQLPAEHHLLAERCLELQADHDATEMLLDAYSTDGWDILRFYAASIFAVMVLIDQEDEADDATRTHPKAATRIFQFMGYLSVMWSIPAYIKAQQKGLEQPDPDDLPSTEEIEAYHALVVAPAFADAVLIARAAGAQSTINDLGSAEDFVADVRAAQLHSGSEMRTKGALEYDSLLPINLALMQLLELKQFIP